LQQSHQWEKERMKLLEIEHESGGLEHAVLEDTSEGTGITFRWTESLGKLPDLITCMSRK